MRRVAAILAFVACVLSGAGVSRAVHMFVAHGGGSCASHGAAAHGGAAHGGAAHGATAHGAAAHVGPCGHAHRVADAAMRAEDAADIAPAGIHQCPVCDELSLAGGCPTLAAPFADVIALLETMHDREASLLTPPCAPEACAARPPPARA